MNKLPPLGQRQRSNGPAKEARQSEEVKRPQKVPKPRPKRHRQPHRFRGLKAFLGLVIFLAGIATIFWLLNPDWLDKQQAATRVDQGNHMKITKKLKLPSKGIEYGDFTNGKGGDISLKQLKKDAKAGYPVYKRGEIAFPRQRGVSVGIHVAIFEGTSVTALAYGAGTAKPNEQMGQGNYALSAHNMADNVTYFSPLQNKIHTKYRPYAFVTDKKSIYEYRIFNQTHDPKGKVIVPLTDIAVLADDPTGKAQLTLTTCYETPPDYANAKKRVIVRGELTAIKQWKQAPKSWRALFNN